MAVFVSFYKNKSDGENFFEFIVSYIKVWYNKNMKKVFNYRPLVSICLFAIAGIVFVCGFYIADTFHIILSWGMLACLICTVIFKAVKCKDKKIFKIISIIIAFGVFALVAYFNILTIEGTNNFNGYMKVYGRVTDSPYFSAKGKYVVTLDHAYVIKSGKAEKVSNKVMLYLTPEDGMIKDILIGSTIVVDATVSKPKFVFGNNYFYYATQNVSLTGFGSEGYVKLVGTSDRSLAQKYKLEIKNSLDYWLDENYSELAYTMTFGDRGELDEDISNVFRSSGIAHLLAVSGLHVGFIATLLSFLLGIFKTNDKIKFVVIGTVIFIYAILCGFTISITRALIMTIVLLYMNMRRKENDGLSSLALACVIVLLINPLQIYSAGFRLSFGAVLGIMLLANTFERFFAKAFHKKLASALAVSISAQLGTLPTLIMCFDGLSIFSIVANLFAIPIASVAFMIMFSFSILGAIFKPLGFGLIVFEWLMKVVTMIGRIMGSILLAGANKTIILVFSFLLIASAIIGSDYMFVKRKPKIIITSIIACVAGMLLVVSFCV